MMYRYMSDFDRFTREASVNPHAGRLNLAISFGMQAREAALAGIHAKYTELNKEYKELCDYEKEHGLGEYTKARKARLEEILGNLKHSIATEEARKAGFAHPWQMKEAKSR